MAKGIEPANKKKARNKEIYEDYTSGMKMVDMVIKYHISSVRIYKIIQDYKRAIDNDIKVE